MMRGFFVICAILLPAFLACEPPEIIQSKWTASDSALAEDTIGWKGIVQYPDDPQFGVGVRNDNKFLYLCMTSWKRDVNGRILRYGFTTWFTSKSKKGKRFGIHFPIGQMGNAEGAGRRHHRGGNDPGAERAMMQESFQQMELLGPGKNDSVPVKTAVAATFGIVVTLLPAEEKLVYLMKIPFNSDSISKYAMDIGKDTLITTSFETGVPDLPASAGGGGQESSPPMGAGGGGAHGAGGGGMHGGGGREGSSGGEIVEPFTAAFEIGLAKKP
jgi:hypothetical protein